MNLKQIALQLCTCTWVEIMTGAGITLYMLYLQNYSLAALTASLFAPLIAFHFAIDRHGRMEGWQRRPLVRIRPLKSED